MTSYRSARVGDDEPGWLKEPGILIEVPVSTLKGKTESEIAEFIRLKKYEFGRQLQDIMTKWIRENVSSITLPEPPVRN